MTNSNWLDDLDTLPDLRTKPTRKPKAPKAKGQQAHIRGETHTFISVSLEQFNQIIAGMVACNLMERRGDVLLPVVV